MKGNIVEIYGVEKNLKGWADYLGISKQLLNYKINKSGGNRESVILAEIYKKCKGIDSSEEGFKEMKTNKNVKENKKKKSYDY